MQRSTNNVCFCVWATCENASDEYSIANITESKQRPQQGHSAAHVLQLLWGKSIFPWGELSSKQFLPAAGFGPHRWLPHFGMLASYASSNKDMMLDGNLHPKCVRVCVCVCEFALSCGEERARGRGAKRVQEKMKENELGKKSKRAQRNKSTELYPPGTKEKVQRERKGRKRKTWTPEPPPLHTHWLIQTNTAFYSSHVFTMFSISWHFYIFATEWLWWAMVLRPWLWLRYYSRDCFVSTLTRWLVEWLPLPSAIKVPIKLLPFSHLTIFSFACLTRRIKKTNWCFRPSYLFRGFFSFFRNTFSRTKTAAWL